MFILDNEFLSLKILIQFIGEFELKGSHIYTECSSTFSRTSVINKTYFRKKIIIPK